MVTYKPIKRIIIPILGLIIGGTIAFLFIPSKMDYNWRLLTNQTNNWEKKSYSIEAEYFVDNKKATEEHGKWSEKYKQYNINAIVSDDSMFSFKLFLEKDRLFVNFDEEWYQNDSNSRFVEELTPLQHPFEWIRELLLDADQMERITNEDKITYTASFVSLEDYEFRGILLQEQTKTKLVVIERNGNIESATFDVTPIRPESVGVFDGYPDKFHYNLTFNEIEKVDFTLPKEAYDSEILE